MKLISLNKAAAILEAATIVMTIDAGHAIVHYGTDEAGRRFILINDTNGETAISYAM